MTQEMHMRSFQYLVTLFAIVLLATTVVAAEENSSLDAEVAAGYRSVSTDNNGDRAREYDYLHSSPTFDLLVKGHTGPGHLILEGNYLDENDYRVETHLDHAGMARVELRAERFYHNLDHIPYVTGAQAIAEANTTPADDAVRAEYFDHNPGADYGVKLDTYEAKFRGKLKSYPAHLNVSYWRYEKQGDQQLRFNSEQCTGCHVQSRSNDINWVTQEFTAGVDAHVGPVDIAFEQLYRDFDNKENSPVNTFGSHIFFRPTVEDLAHDSVPDSRLTESTLRLHTDLSGGVVGAASFSIGQRKNRADLSPTEATPVKSDTDFYKGAGDLTWIPNPSWTFNFRYRLIDLDNDNNSTINIYGINPSTNPVPVRDNIDLRRNNYIATVSYRPFNKLTLKGEFEREDIHRGNADGAIQHTSGRFGGPVDIDPVWEVPKDEQINRVKLSFFSRPMADRSLKLNGWWEHQQTGDPAYGTSFENSDQLFLGANYHSKGIWGANLSADAIWQKNDQYQITEFASGAPVEFDIDRKNKQQHLSAGLWMTPVAGVYASFNYGYLNSDIKQDMLFGNGPPAYAIEDEGVDYNQSVHTFSASMDWQFLEKLRCNLAGFYTQSKAKYSPGFSRFYAPSGIFDATSTGLEEISEVNLRQTGLKAGLTWQMQERLSCTVDYTYDDYEDRNSSVFDGTVQTYMANLAYAW